MAGAGYKLFQTGDVLTAAQVNTYLNEQTVMVFASAAARTSALSGVLAEGMVSYLQDTNAVEVYDGSAWVSIGASGDITAVNVSSPITGGGTSGAVTISIQDGTTAQKGAIQLEDSTSSTSTTKAATPNSVKSAYDLANGAIPKSLVDAAGDLIYATADNTVARLGIGTAGQVLKVNSGATAPEWGAASGSASFVGCRLKQTAGQTISNNTNTAIQWNSEDYDTDAFHDNSTNNTRVTIPSGKAGKYLFVGNCFNDTGAATTVGRMGRALHKNGTAVNTTYIENTTSASSYETWTIHTVLDLAVGDYVQWFVSQTSGGNGTTTDASLCVSYLGA